MSEGTREGSELWASGNNEGRIAFYCTSLLYLGAFHALPFFICLNLFIIHFHFHFGLGIEINSGRSLGLKRRVHL